jgi:molybdopterin-containing oxidoreductase family membrane subunit
MIDRVLGRYGYVFIIVLITVVAFPQLLWIRKLRRSPGFLFAIGMIVQAGMWGERYMITVQSLYRDYLPSSWGYFSGSKWDYFIFIGSFGLFFTMQLLLLRLVPIVSISEMREIIEKLKQKRAGP